MTKKHNTKARLLQAACEIFAEKGFHETTVSDICELAEANIASVNYYFCDKETLYDEVWRHAFAVTVSTYPMDCGGAEPNDGDVESCIYGYARAVLHRIFSNGEAGLFPRLLNQEMASPTLALDKIAKEALLPQSQQVEKAIIKQFGQSVDDEQLRLCKHSIIGQCAFYNFSRPLRQLVLGGREMNSEAIDTMARHIARFSLGGLEAVQPQSTNSGKGK